MKGRIQGSLVSMASYHLVFPPTLICFLQRFALPNLEDRGSSPLPAERRSVFGSAFLIWF